MWTWMYQLGTPKIFYRISGLLLPWLGFICVALLAYGLVGGLYLAPPDYQQGNAFRIIYVHVPCAFMSLGVYTSMTVLAIISFIWKIKLADALLKASAPLGAWFTFLTLVTGSIWGKPMWGTWWVWDARLTSELILLFIYLGIIALRQAIPDRAQAARAVAILVMVGFVNIPIIHYSVYWWNTLHQGDTINFFGQSLMAPSMLHPLFAMIFAFGFYYAIVLLLRGRNEVLRRQAQTQWAQEILAQ